jgi:hypothetical protein
MADFLEVPEAGFTGRLASAFGRSQPFRFGTMVVCGRSVAEPNEGQWPTDWSASA